MKALLRLLAWTLAVALVALPVVAVVNGWVGGTQWPLRTLRVQGALQRVDESRLRATVLPFAKRGFFAVPLDRIQAEVGALPWVDRAEVRKHWPDVLEVRISEHRPFARWGEARVLSVNGHLFPVGAASMPAGLPLLDGPDGRVADVVALYNQAREELAGAGGVRGVVLDRRGSWSIALANGIEVVLGRNDPQARLARFAPLLPRLLASQGGRPLLRADLRYTNGFALIWGELPKPATHAPMAVPALPQPVAIATHPSPRPSPASGRGRIPQEALT
jgi:cell division protein FtsQ